MGRSKVDKQEAVRKLLRTHLERLSQALSYREADSRKAMIQYAYDDLEDKICKLMGVQQSDGFFAELGLDETISALFGPKK